MTNREILENNGYEPDNYVLFTNPNYDGAVVGVSDTDQVIYDYDLMIEAAMREEDWSYEEAVDWINVNAIRSLVYVDNAPIIQYRLYTDEEI